MQNVQALYKHKFLTIVSLLILITVSLFSSCKKEDDIAPVVSIQTPIGGSYSVNDTISVQAKISDNETIVSVRIRLINMDNQQVVSPYTYSVNASSYQLNANFVIDNLYLESGEYYLVVEADDGINTGKDFVSIQVGALTRVLEDVLVVEKDNLQTHIYSVLNGKLLLKTFNMEYQDFLYNPYSEQYIFLSKKGILTAYDKEELESVWSISNLKDPLHEFYGQLLYKDKLVYVSSYTGAIQVFDGNGNLVKQANTIDTEGQVSQFFFGMDKIMAFKEPYVFGDDKIEELNEVTGASVQTYEIDFSPEQLLFVDDELCVVFGNRYNKAKACSLSTMYNVVHPFGDFGNREFGDAFKHTNYLYIISLDQEILEYDLSNGNERILESTQTNTHFFYEDLYEKLYFVDDKKIFNLNFPAVGSQLFYTNNRTIDDLVFVYNK